MQVVVLWEKIHTGWTEHPNPTPKDPGPTWGLNPEPSYCKETMLTTNPSCCQKAETISQRKTERNLSCTQSELEIKTIL